VFRRTLIDADIELDHAKPTRKKIVKTKVVIIKPIKPVFKLVKYKRQLPTVFFRCPVKPLETPSSTRSWKHSLSQIQEDNMPIAEQDETPFIREGAP
jgi:hypothetical protein